MWSLSYTNLSVTIIHFGTWWHIVCLSVDLVTIIISTFGCKIIITPIPGSQVSFMLFMVSVLPPGCVQYGTTLQSGGSLESKEPFLSTVADWTVLDQSNNEHKCLNQVVFAFNTTDDKLISNRPSLQCEDEKKSGRKQKIMQLIRYI